VQQLPAERDVVARALDHPLGHGQRRAQVAGQVVPEAGDPCRAAQVPVVAPLGEPGGLLCVRERLARVAGHSAQGSVEGRQQHERPQLAARRGQRATLGERLGPLVLAEPDAPAEPERLGVSCLKKGGDDCPARSGNHLYGVCFDLGPCVAPHPSTLGMALLAYDGQIEVAGHGSRPVTALYGDGSDGRRDHRLGDHELLTAVQMPTPLEGERSAYFRATSRAMAEWPLVEAIVRLAVSDGTIEFARVAVGGVAPIPLRLQRVEEALTGRPASPDVVERAASLAAERASPLPMTRYKAALLPPTVRGTLDRALA
jgi:CO/xanthine dehydrogenase FAD-binding subunit